MKRLGQNPKKPTATGATGSSAAGGASGGNDAKFVLNNELLASVLK